MWRFQSPAGVFLIRQGANAARWELVMRGALLGTFDAPEDAVLAVVRQRTGVAAWDVLPNAAAPRELSAWESVR